ncbi:MAG: DUF2095 family protein [Candidatus Bathyarchaeota archaeon]|nr:MAG: DUF2095 family protein [Candidatus Bathyarchaeota archaeon]
MQMDRKRFKKMFPHLAEEMNTKESRIAISSVRSDIQTGETASSREFVRYTPDVIDYIRRCDNEQQAKEIINYLVKRKEITRQYARRLRKQLKEKGVRSFGPKKEEDYYLKKYASRSTNPNK